MDAASPTLVYIRWFDAHYEEGETKIEEIQQRCELQYVGFLVKTTDEAVTLSLECPDDGRTRNPFTIPRQNIIEIRETTLKKAFPKRRASKKAVIAEQNGPGTNGA